VIRIPKVLPILAVCFSLVGLADSVYLTANHLTNQSVPCDIVVGCEKVLSSEYSEFRGIPISILGAFAYFISFSAATLSFNQNRYAWMFLTVHSTGMAVFSGWLVYLQAFVIGAFCQFCLLSAATSMGLFLTTSVSWIFLREKRI